MPVENIDLTIEGAAGDQVQVWYRGNQGSDDPDPAPIIYTARIGTNGRVIVSVPREYLALGRPVRRGATPLDLREEKAASKTVRLPPE